MGLFSSSTKTSVFSNALPLCDSDVNVLQASMMAGILEGQAVSDTIKQVAFQGIASQVNRMRRYAKNHYTLGLPTGRAHISQTLDDEDVADVITAERGLAHGCTVVLNYVSSLTNYHLIVPFLEENRGYDAIANTVSILPPDAPEPSPPTITHWQRIEGVSHTVNITDLAFSFDIDDTGPAQIDVEYTRTSVYTVVTPYTDDSTWEAQYDHDPVTKTQTFTETLAFDLLTNMNIGARYLIAKYYPHTDAGGTPATQADWFYYEMSSNKYPELNNTPVMNDSEQLYPVVPLRKKDKDLCSEPYWDTELYKTSKKLLKYLGLDIQELRDGLNGNNEGGNPNSVKDIDHAYVMFGVNLNDPGPESIRYLTEFFDYLAQAALVTVGDKVESLINGDEVKAATYQFGDYINPAGQYTTTEYSDDFVTGESTSYQRTVVRKNSAISIDEYGLDIGIRYTAISTELKEGSIGKVNTATMEFVSATRGDNSAPLDPGYYGSFKPSNNAVVRFRLQITENSYKEVEVVGLQHWNEVKNNYNVVTTIGDIKDDDENHNFIIPLHHEVAKKIPPIHRNQLYLESLHLICQSVVKEKVKWYQKSFFKVLSVIVLIVLFAITQNPIFIKAAVTLMIMEVLTGLLPPEILAALTIAVAVVRLATGDFTAVLAGQATATTYLNMVTSIMSIRSTITNLQMLELADDFEALQDEIKKEYDAIKELEDFIKGETEVPLLSYLGSDRAKIGPETHLSPTDYYFTKLLTNPGILILNHPHYSATMGVELPDMTKWVRRPTHNTERRTQLIQGM